MNQRVKQKLAGVMSLLTGTLLAASISHAQTFAVEPYEHRLAIQNAIVEERLDTLLPLGKMDFLGALKVGA